MNNTGRESRTFTLRINNVIRSAAMPEFKNMRNHEMAAVSAENGEHIYPTRSGRFEGFARALERGVLSGGNSMMKLDGRTMALELHGDQLMNYYYWLSATGVNTWEWMYLPMTLKPGQQWSTDMKYFSD